MIIRGRLIVGCDGDGVIHTLHICEDVHDVKVKDHQEVSNVVPGDAPLRTLPLMKSESNFVEDSKVVIVARDYTVAIPMLLPSPLTSPPLTTTTPASGAASNSLLFRSWVRCRAMR
ncbi:hypothetical protein Tco_0167328 [Tanacetum coccineum]